MPVELSVDQQALAAVGKALRSEADGKFLRRELIKTLKRTADEPIDRAKAAILAAPSKGLTEGQPLRAAIAASIKPTARLSGRTTGVSIRQSRTPQVRTFPMAGRRFNRGPFRRPVYGKAWVTQTGQVDWFDRPMQDSKPDFKRDVTRVVQDLADTLAARARDAARQ